MKGNHKENLTESLNWWKADTQFSVPRVHCPEERSTEKEVGNCQYTSALTRERLKLFFAQFLLISSISTEQSQICVKTVNPSMIEQGDWLWKDNPTHCLCQWVRCLSKEDLLQKYQERVERVSQQNRVTKTCTDAGSWQRLSQWHVVSTVCHGMKKSTDPKCWIRGNTKIWSVLEVTTSYLQGKYEVEIRFESVNKDNSHSWVRISHGLNKLVTDLIDREYDDNEQETTETKM